MKEFKVNKLKREYIDFFKSKGHTEIKSASLVPDGDGSVLFTIAGMQPLVPYLLGDKHPSGTRLVDSQKCLRTVDIEDVGDKSHLTFFEMLGNWSLGDYFKNESIEYSFEFLTKHLMIPIDKLAVTVFCGDDEVPRDDVSAKKWEELGIKKENIFYLGKEHNWWCAGEEGPCGPDTEIFYIFDGDKCSDSCSPACSCGKYMEIWNNVFMEYNKTSSSLVPLKQKNVDTGMGLERIVTVSQNKDSVYDTDVFYNTMSKINDISGKDILSSKRIVADHIRSSCMLISDGVRPSNVDQGYILRRLIRRALRHMRKLDISFALVEDITKAVLKDLENQMGSIDSISILSVVLEEASKFERTLTKGLKKLNEEISKASDNISKEVVFKLYDTYGFPPEVTNEIALEHGMSTDMDGFKELFKLHQEKSRKGAEAKFKGGLKSDGMMETKYHTATHLLNRALKDVLGEHVHQKGSNITEERLRFDFSHPEKVSKEDLKKVEDIVNDKIKEDLVVAYKIVSKEDAINSGAEAMFIDRYGDEVKVYSIGDYSVEVCGGAHVNSTKELGHFKIKKEESSSSGVRRIKAVLEDNTNEK